MIMSYKKIVLKTLKIGGIVCISLVGLILITSIAIHLSDPSYFTEFFVNSVDHGLYLGIEFGPFEKSFRLQQIGPDSSYNGGMLRWSPNKKMFAFAADVPEPERSDDVNWVVNIINPLTYKTRTIIVSSNDGTFYWLNDNTIRYFRGTGTGSGGYKDININEKEPLKMAEEFNNEHYQGWNYVTLEKLSEMERELAKINPRY